MSSLERLSDDELRARLKEIDEDASVDVSSWTADFIETVVYTNAAATMSPKQRTKAREIIEKYGR